MQRSFQPFWGLPGAGTVLVFSKAGAAEPDRGAENVPRTTARDSMDPEGGMEAGMERAAGAGAAAGCHGERRRHRCGDGEGWDWEPTSLLPAEIAGGHNKMPR